MLWHFVLKATVKNYSLLTFATSLTSSYIVFPLSNPVTSQGFLQIGIIKHQNSVKVRGFCLQDCLCTGSQELTFLMGPLWLLCPNTDSAQKTAGPLWLLCPSNTRRQSSWIPKDSELGAGYTLTPTQLEIQGRGNELNLQFLQATTSSYFMKLVSFFLLTSKLVSASYFMKLVSLAANFFTPMFACWFYSFRETQLCFHKIIY